MNDWELVDTTKSARRDSRMYDLPPHFISKLSPDSIMQNPQLEGRKIRKSANAMRLLEHSAQKVTGSFRG